jgi:hypothetical protein
MTTIINCEITQPTISTSPYEVNDIIKAKVNAYVNGHSNISKVTLSLDNNEITTMTEPAYYHDINTKDIETGKHVLKAVAEDGNGFTSSDEVVFYLEPEALGEAPEINIANLPSEVSQADSIAVINANISDADGEIINADLYIDDRKLPFTDTTGTTYQRDWHLTDYELGLHEIKVIAKDDDDNERTKRQNVTIIE